MGPWLLHDSHDEVLKILQWCGITAEELEEHHRSGVTVHPHLFRHTLAQGVLDTTGNIKVAQEILGRAHLSTTAELYMRVDQHAQRTSRKAAQYAFEYDDQTIAELERTIEQASRLKPAGEES